MTSATLTPIASATPRMNGRAFASALALNFVWMNASEVFRYFAFVMPMMREALPQIDSVAPMDLGVFLVWGLWDAILVAAVTGFVWIFLDRFGAGLRQALIGATLIWLTVFGLLWLGIFNMGLATVEILAVALPLAWAELAIAGLIVLWRYRS